MKFTTMLDLIVKTLNKNSDTQVDVCMTSKMANQIELWTTMFKNRPWWVDNKKVFGMNLPASISSEFSRLVTLEHESEVVGSPRADYLNEQYKGVLNDLRRNVQLACAKGGMVFKPYVTQKGISVQYVQADCFFPISFDDSGHMTQCVFAEQVRRGKNIYTRLEMHEMKGERLHITNKAFVSTNDYSFGVPISLGSVDRWSKLSPGVVYEGADGLPLGYLRIPSVNAEDTDSPLGTSVYAQAVDSIRVADKRYSQVDWEYDAKEAAVHIADSLLKYDKTRDAYEYPGGKERLYRSVEYSSGAKDKPLLDTYSPDIRDESYYRGLDKQLKLIEFQCNLAYGTISDPQNVDKTAEEIKASKQRSYTAVSEIQKATQTALKDLVRAMDFYTTIYNLAPIGTYGMNFRWDDSVVVDKEKELLSMQQDAVSGMIRKELYIAKKYGVTEEEALKMIPAQPKGFPDDE